MSVAIDTISKVHQKQVEAVTKSQDVVATVLDKVSGAVSDLQGRAPAVPESLAGPLKTIAEPLSKLVGTREELTAYVAQSVRDWAELQQQAQAKVVDRLGTKA